VRTLFDNKYYSPVFLWLAGLSWFAFPSLSIYSYIALVITIHQFVQLFNSIGHVIPVRFLFSTFMCLQFFVGAIFAYNGLDEFQYPPYRMQVAEAVYFSYTIPAVLAFIIGSHISDGGLKGEKVNLEGIQEFVQRKKLFPYIFIIIGFFSSIISAFLPAEIGFVFHIFGGFKFVGLFLLILGSEKLKVAPLIIVFGSIISSSLGSAMFHDLLTWLLFTGAVFCIRYKPTALVKIFICVGFILLAVVIQQLKTGLRNAAKEGKKAGLETLSQVYYDQQQHDAIFGFHSLAPSNVRINQGFIISYIMTTVPARVPYSNGGELYQILEAAIMPRVLAPNKLSAGDRSIFTKYSSIPLDGGTSMGLSSVGDAYINFGLIGGCVFMFLLGLMYSEILKGFERYSKIFPILILFTPLIFYYPIRPDSELQTSLGHALKGCFIIFVIFRVFKEVFRNKPKAANEEYSTLSISA
jgi:hypothetical protein